jgi:hypothetical protein
MMEAEATKPALEKFELRRDATVWGSYIWGYADVGADIHAALVMGACSEQALREML